MPDTLSDEEITRVKNLLTAELKADIEKDLRQSITSGLKKRYLLLSKAKLAVWSAAAIAALAAAGYKTYGDVETKVKALATDTAVKSAEKQAADTAKTVAAEKSKEVAADYVNKEGPSIVKKAFDASAPGMALKTIEESRDRAVELLRVIESSSKAAKAASISPKLAIQKIVLAHDGVQGVDGNEPEWRAKWNKFRPEKGESETGSQFKVPVKFNTPYRTAPTVLPVIHGFAVSGTAPIVICSADGPITQDRFELMIQSWGGGSITRLYVVCIILSND